jgi:hypothetical protein
MCANFSKSSRFEESSGCRSEGDHPHEQIFATSYYEDKRTIPSSIGLDVPASPEPRLDQTKHLSPVAVLADVKLRDQLIAALARGITVHDDREAAFSVYIARDIAIQPFLLIVRTRHIVTVPPDPDGSERYE